MPSAPPSPVISPGHTAHRSWTGTGRPAGRSEPGPALIHTRKWRAPERQEEHESLWPWVWKLSRWPGRGGCVIIELLGIGLLTGEVGRGNGLIARGIISTAAPPLPPPPSSPNNYYLDCINGANRCTQTRLETGRGNLRLPRRANTQKHSRTHMSTHPHTHTTQVQSQFSHFLKCISSVL